MDYNFDEASAKRIIASVRRTETDRNHTRWPRNRPGGDDESFRLIRAQSVGNQTSAIIVADNVVVLAGGMDPSYGNPAAQILIDNSTFPRVFVNNQDLMAVYSPAVSFNGTFQVDWELIEVGSGAGTALPQIPSRGFVLIQPKYLTQGTASVLWLDEEGLPVGTAVDAEEIRDDLASSQGLYVFAGRTDNYISGEDGFKGLAQWTEYPGTGTGEATQDWSIMAMEGFARWILVKLEQVGTAVVPHLIGVGSPSEVAILDPQQWQRKPPAIVGGEVILTYDYDDASDAMIVESDVGVGDVLLCVLVDPDGDGDNLDDNGDPLPIYRPVAKRDNVRRLIRGLATGDVTADDGSFTIDNVVPLASGYDPTGGDSGAVVVVLNVQAEAFENNTPITAIYNGSDWELLLVERYRAILGLSTGLVSTADSVFNVNNVSSLDSGVDPTANNPATTIPVLNFGAQSFGTGEPVVADYHVNSNAWLARPKAARSGSFLAVLEAAIAAASSITSPSSQVAEIYFVSFGGFTSSVGTHITYWHGHYPLHVNGRYPCEKSWSDPVTPANDQFVITVPSYPNYDGDNIQVLMHGTGDAPPSWTDTQLVNCGT